MKVLICGDRNWRDYTAIKQYVSSLPPNTVIIEGDARGADQLAGLAAKEQGLPTEIYPAQWAIYGRAAGPIRNKQMLDEGKPDLVVYFHLDLDSSKGTKDMVTRATKAGIPVINGGQ